MLWMCGIQFSVLVLACFQILKFAPAALAVFFSPTSSKGQKVRDRVWFSSWPCLSVYFNRYMNIMSHLYSKTWHQIQGRTISLGRCAPKSNDALWLPWHILQVEWLSKTAKSKAALGFRGQLFFSGSGGPRDFLGRNVKERIWIQEIQEFSCVWLITVN